MTQYNNMRLLEVALNIVNKGFDLLNKTIDAINSANGGQGVGCAGETPGHQAADSGRTAGEAGETPACPEGETPAQQAADQCGAANCQLSIVNCQLPEPGETPANPTANGGAANLQSSTFNSQSSYRADAIRFNEQFLNENYDLRFNTMKKATEFRPKTSDGQGDAEWRTMTDRDLNSMTVSQLKAGGQSWSYAMRLCIDSSDVENYNPVENYLNSLPAWDQQHDYIGELAARVPTRYDAWPQMFHRWLLAMVAQVSGMSRDYGNSLVPMLIGDQGTRKSTFCKNLLPQELREYYMDDIKMDSAEQVERVLGRMWLVNIDEYDAKTNREQAKIKRLLTERDVQVRRPRSDQYNMMRRICSFIATTNNRRPLTDTTGSRRYLCVELDGEIDTTTPINHDQLFAQALYELQHGAQFWLTREEERALEAHNAQYNKVLAIEPVITSIFQPVPTSPDSLLTSTEIRDLLEDSIGVTDMPTKNQLAAALHKLGFRRGAQNGRHGWYCCAIDN